jgi:positive regulator of sigma E activity
MNLNEHNPIVSAFFLAIIYLVSFVLLEYLLFRKNDYTGPLIGSIIFFFAYLLIRRYSNSIIEKKIKN